MDDAMVWNPLASLRAKMAAARAVPREQRSRLDPASEAAFEASWAKNREAMERLAKL